MQTKEISIDKLVFNEGQIDGLGFTNTVGIRITRNG